MLSLFLKKSWAGCKVQLEQSRLLLFRSFRQDELTGRKKSQYLSLFVYFVFVGNVVLLFVLPSVLEAVHTKQGNLRSIISNTIEAYATFRIGPLKCGSEACGTDD